MLIKYINLKKLQIIFFYTFIFSLPLNYVPHKFTIISIGNNLAVYPLIFGIICFIYENKSKKIANRVYLLYFLIYIVWQLLCTAIGVINYKYINLIDIHQISKLCILLKYIRHYNIYLENNTLIKTWFVIRFFKDIIKHCFIIFGIPLWIYYLYHDNFKLGFSDIRRAVLAMILIMCCYSVIEMFYLRGYLFAANILVKINPFLYDIKSAHGWWPPLLWQGQLRSIMAEPSYFGIISAMIIPILFSCIFESSKFRYILLCFFYLFMLFLSKARTGITIYLGELFLFIVIFYIYYRSKWKKILIILGCTVCAFLTTLIVFNNDMPNANLSAAASTYVEQNIASVIGNKRSNSARRINTVSMIKVGLQHPLFGVGQGLKDAYINDTLTTQDLATNDEVHTWSRYMYSEGVLKSGFPVLNYFTYIFASFGVIGLLLYIIPIIYIFIKLYMQRVILRNDIQLGCVLIAFCGSIAALFSNGDFFLNIYILYGLLLCKTDGTNFER